MCVVVVALVLTTLSSSVFLSIFSVGIFSIPTRLYCCCRRLYRRPKKPRPEERKGVARTVWQFVHRFGGRVSLLLALANGSLGIFLAVCSLPIIIAWHAWVGLLLFLCLVGEFIRCCTRVRRKGKGGPRQVSSTLQTVGNSQSDGIINGWEKGDGSYVNPTTESVRL